MKNFTQALAFCLSILAIFLGACATPAPHWGGAPVITFDELIQRKEKRHLTWKNPDKTMEAIDFFEMEIPTSPKIDRLAVEFLQDVYPGRDPVPMLIIRPRMIVLHSMALGTLRDSLIESGFLDDEKRWQTPKGGRFPVRAHFIIDQDGTIYCLAPPKDKNNRSSYVKTASFPMRHHLTEANPWAIGVENIVRSSPNAMNLSDGEKQKIFSELSAAQSQANAKLTRFLAATYPSIRRLFGHHQFNDANFRSALQAKKDLLPEASDPQAITTDRFDPGSAFIEQVLDETKKRGFDLSSAP